MPRAPRILYPGAWYHITARGIERRPIFRDARDRAHFLELLEEFVDRFAVQLHAFVLMDNHYHLLLDLSRPNLSRSIQWLNVSHSVWFNRRHQRCGYLFQGRFKSIIVDPRQWGLSLSAYIHLNPVRIVRLGLSKTERRRAKRSPSAQPETRLIDRRISLLRAFRWSSYRAYIGLETPPPWLTRQAIFEYAGGAKNQVQTDYRKHVENQIRSGLPETPWEQIRDQLILGGAHFAQQVKKHATHNGQHSRRWTREATTLEQVIKTVETVRRSKWQEFRHKHGDNGRDLVLYLARRATGLTVAELAGKTGLARGENVSMAVMRYQKRIDENSAERKLAAKAAQMLFVMLKCDELPRRKLPTGVVRTSPATGRAL